MRTLSVNRHDGKTLVLPPHAVLLFGDHTLAIHPTSDCRGVLMLTESRRISFYKAHGEIALEEKVGFLSLLARQRRDIRYRVAQMGAEPLEGKTIAKIGKSDDLRMFQIGENWFDANDVMAVDLLLENPSYGTRRS